MPSSSLPARIFAPFIISDLARCFLFIILALGFFQSSWAAVLSRGAWVANASVSASENPPANALDGNISTRWGTGTPQTNGMWFEVDTGAGTIPTFTNLVLDCGSSTGDYPRNYQVNVSSDGVNWGSPIASGAGSSAVTTINFPIQTARYIKITQTGSVAGLWWSIAELNINGLGPPSPPTKLQAKTGSNQTSLSWLASTGATSYNVKRAMTYAGPYTVIAPNVTSLTYTDASIVSGTLYFYVVSANNSYGESANSSLAMYGVRVVVPSLNTNEVVVAITTPQEYGAVGDGITDDTAAFQNAINAVYNAGGSGGGVIYVPLGNYAFYTNLVIPTGVTLHGNWTDWTKGNGGLAGTTFKVYFGVGQTNAAPFITMVSSCMLKDVNIWYPNQNAANIVGYPFTIGLSGDCVVQNVALVNSYQGIQAITGDRHILSTVVGTPLYLGVLVDQVYDICHSENVRFSPDTWANSGLSNAPPIGGAQATWMRTYGTGMEMIRVDGDLCMDTYISGYNTGILFTNTGNGDPGMTFYSGAITNCATGILAQNMPNGIGLMFANFTLDDDIAIRRTRTDTDANAQFDRCTIIGRNGTAANVTGSDWNSWMQFQDCTISNTLRIDKGVFNVVNSTLLGSTQCIMTANTTRAAFSGCTFAQTKNIFNSGSVSNLLVDARQSISNTMPIINWTNIVNDYLLCRAATTNLYLATAYGATGKGITDDTLAIQTALNAAGNNGGGIVYVPAGLYHLTNTLDIPSGVELRGTYELRHWPAAAADGYAKGTVLRPYEGQNTTNGPVAIALEANSGLVGVTISYETQNNTSIPFPAAIQGRGGNIYAIGIACPNPYYYMDLDTYTCTNHFLYLVDGWTLNTGMNIGHGSSGTIVDCMGNWTYWINNGQSASTLPQNIQAPVLESVLHTSKMYLLGDCTELMVKDFNIIERNYFAARSENGVGPNAILIGDYCDATIQGMVLDAAAPCTIQAVNTTLCVFNVNNDSDLAAATVDILSTTNFQGTARLFNTSLFAQPYWDLNINGGDIGLEICHINPSLNGSVVSNGTLHLVNLSANTSGNVPYNIIFGPNAGTVGETNELIACYSYGGCTFNSLNPNNQVKAWQNYSLSQYAVLDNSLPLINNIYPNGSSLFEYTGTLSFTATSPSGLAPSNVVVRVNGILVTNLIFAGTSTYLDVSDPNILLNTTNIAVITITDGHGNTTSTTISFNTFNPATYTWQAEDYDYTASGVSGLFIDNPQTNSYAGLAAVQGIDAFSVIGNFSTNHAPYRPSGLNQEGASDNPPLPAYNATGAANYDLGNTTSGNWGNYTRAYPKGTYYLYLRAANGLTGSSPGGKVYWVTSGFGTANQTTNLIGTFAVIPATGNWQVYTWVPLKNSSGQLAQISNDGSVKTLKITSGGGYNADYFALVSTNTTLPNIALNASVSSGLIQLTWPLDYLGWHLEMQTNSANVGLSANWLIVPASNLTNQFSVPINPASGNAFFRLAYP